MSKYVIQFAQHNASFHIAYFVTTYSYVCTLLYCTSHIYIITKRKLHAIVHPPSQVFLYVTLVGVVK